MAKITTVSTAIPEKSFGFFFKINATFFVVILNYIYKICVKNITQNFFFKFF